MDVDVTGRRILAIVVDGIIVGLPTGLLAAIRAREAGLGREDG